MMHFNFQQHMLFAAFSFSSYSIRGCCLESDGTTDSEMKYYNGPVWLHCLISYPVDASQYLGMWLDLTTSHRQTWLFSSTSTYHSTDLLTTRGVAHLVIHRTSGSTSYETIPHVRLETSGGVLSTVDMVTQQRDGLRRLGDNDDETNMTQRCEFTCMKLENVTQTISSLWTILSRSGLVNMQSFRQLLRKSLWYVNTSSKLDTFTAAAASLYSIQETFRTVVAFF